MKVFPDTRRLERCRTVTETAPGERRPVVVRLFRVALVVATGALFVATVACTTSSAGSTSPKADRVDRLLKVADGKYEKHEYERAADFYAKADRAADGRSARAIAGIALSSLYRLRYDEAIAAAERLIDSAATPDIRAAGYQYLGLALHRRGLTERWGERIERQGAGVAPGDLKALVGSSAGEASMRAAAGAFRRALDVLGEDGQGLHHVLLNLADVLSWLDDDQKALAVLDAYAAAGGTDPYAVQVRCSVQFGADGRSGDAKVMGGPQIVEGDVQRPVRIHSPAPQYTEAARAARLQGLVIVQAIVSEEGTIDCARPLVAEHYPLAQMALSAVTEWRFEPARLDSEPVAVFFNLTVHFTLQ